MPPGSAADPVTQYARDVLDGSILAGRAVHLACQRHLADLDRADTDEFPYVFDPQRAERVFDFFGFCRHTVGPLAQQPIILSPFQQFVVGSIFGWVHRSSGLRRFRKAYVQLARKNGKSMILSGLGLYMLMADGEFGSQVFATATKKDQAKIVYDAARIMAHRSPDLLKRLEPGKAEIVHPDSGESYFRPLSKDTKSLDGFNPHLGIVDEYHAHPTAEMVELLTSGMGQRLQPLLFIITTAGFDLAAPCYEEYRFCLRVLEGEVAGDAADQYFVYVAQLDKEDSPQDEACWVKANPILPDAPHMADHIRTELAEAIDDPRKLRNVMTKLFNAWVDQREDGYMPMDRWRACAADEKNPLPDLTGQPCYIGVDLSAKLDLTSVAIEFPLPDERYALVQHSFIPDDRLGQRRKTDLQPFDLWVQQGWLTATPGAVVDEDYIIHWIDQQAADHGWDVQEICVDPWAAAQFGRKLQQLGYVVVEIPQGIRHLSEPTKAFREAVMKGRLIHDGSPVATWAAGNAVVWQDAKENIMLDKKKARERIDPIAAAVNAHARAMHGAAPVDVSEFASAEFLDQLWGGD